MTDNPTLTQTQLMEKMDLTRKQVQIDMKELQKQGLLIREGTNRKGRWIVKNNQTIQKENEDQIWE